MPVTRAHRKLLLERFSTATTPTTRSRGKVLQEKAASRFEVQAVLRFENEDHIKRFTAGASANSNVGTALEHLTIVFKHAYPLRLLRGALEVAPNLTDLILLLPAPFPHRLLEGLTFINLRLLKTNLPHGRVVTFLSANSTVRFLDLGPCGKLKDCPLRIIDLSRIPDIRCPIECCTGIVHPAVTRVRMDLTRPRTAVSPILRSFPVRFIAVYVLSLQFTAMDDDILPNVARFAPMVRVLRLWERADYGPITPQTPRPWLNAIQLRDNLLSMWFLTHFVVRTTASFVAVPGLPQERAIIFKWTGENTVSKRHPRLKFVAVWYRATYFGEGTLTRWEKADGVWGGVSVDSPTEGELGTCV